MQPTTSLRTLSRGLGQGLTMSVLAGWLAIATASCGMDESAMTAEQVTTRLEAALADAVRLAITVDHAQAVIIGGGPLARAARALASQFDVPIIEPIPAAVQAMVQALGY